MKSSSKFNINDGVIDSLIPYSQCYWILRSDFLPFLLAYGILVIACLHDDVLVNNVALAIFPCILGGQLVLFLLSQWSIELKCNIGGHLVEDLQYASVVHVKAAKNIGRDSIQLLQRNPDMAEKEISICGNIFRTYQLTFEFQKIPYGFCSTRKTFIRLEYPSVGPIGDFINASGHVEIESFENSLRKWGMNAFDIPIPPFLDMYMENLTAPFFVFQVLCLLLWSLDDYWYYSMFTLFMLMFFEGMMTKQRQSSLIMLRQMRRAPFKLYVFRSKSWMVTSSDELCPGDIISLNTVPLVQKGRNNINHSGEPSADDGVVVPCDAIILPGGGSVVVNEAMLTGESVPQVKEPLNPRLVLGVTDGSSSSSGGNDTETSEEGSVKLDLNGEGVSRHILLGGTLLLQQQPSLVEGEVSALPSPPDGGCTALVVRTGFGTIQGGLMRKILFATERIQASNADETFYFIAVLVVFAVAASTMILYYGLMDPDRNRFKLVLHCIMIVTSVVPPELPMELSLAVTNSLAALSRSMIYCTEPFRIPFAGKLNVLCFDKTGTLTKDKMILKGVVMPQEIDLFGKSSSPLTEGEGDAAATPTFTNTIIDVEDPKQFVPAVVGAVMASCHSLILLRNRPELAKEENKRYMGDPLEVAAMEASGFKFHEGNDKTASPLIVKSAKYEISIRIVHRYPFTSTLKRMSVIVEVEHSSGAKSLLLLTKGAPEVLSAHCLDNVPSFYASGYLHHMARGKRVLAMTCKRLGTTAALLNEILKKPREAIERNCNFVGFLVYDSELKCDSISVCQELQASNHVLKMITGDSALTACEISRRLGILRRDAPTFILHRVTGKDSEEVLVWREFTIEGAEDSPTLRKGDILFDINGVAELAARVGLCLTGPAMSLIADSASCHQLCPHVAIFARVTPAQKEQVILALKESGLYTLMCGDGTNDVGALKAAHVGVSIINDAEFENRIEAKGKSGSKSAEKKSRGGSAKDRMARALIELQEQEMDPTIIKFGDASIASPFTSRRTSIDSVMTVLRQGRATLVTTVQVFKILALNCLVSAYMMSALYLKGLKQGDMQMTASGLMTAGLFFFLSQAKPVPFLAPKKPPSSAFDVSVLCSVVGQFVVHLLCILLTTALCDHYSSSDDPVTSADGKFQANVVNSAMYLLSCVMQVNNFVVNYRGHPFTQSIDENAALWRSVQIIYVSLAVLLGGQVEPINDFLQLVPFPSSQFQVYLLGILGFNFAATYLIEKQCQKLEL